MAKIAKKSPETEKKSALNAPKLALAVVAAAGLGATSPASAVASLNVTVGDIQDGSSIPARFSYCMPDRIQPTKNGGNLNPAISWAGAPAGTRSYAIIVVDPDVPASFELANQPHKAIPADYPRRDFYHWVLVDIPANVTSIAEGQVSNGVNPDGKPTGKTPLGITGHNDYSGHNGGYDGPCPPWNDAHLHHYHFRVYALDVATLNLPADFGGKEAEKAIAGHILAQGEVVGTYTTNPAVH